MCVLKKEKRRKGEKEKRRKRARACVSVNERVFALQENRARSVLHHFLFPLGDY